MSSNIIMLITSILIGILSAICIYNILSILADKKINIKELLNETTDIEDFSVTKHFKTIEKEEPKLIKYIKGLLTKANIRSPLVNVTSVILISVISGVIGFSISKSFLTSIQALIVGAFFITLPGVIILLYGEKIGTRTNQYFIDFLGILQNYLEIKDDINFAMDNVRNPRFKLGVLNRFAEEYMYDIKHGYTIEQALNNFSLKIDNGEIKNLCQTLTNCSKTSGKYLLVVKRYAENYTEIFDKLIERQDGAKKERKQILLMLVSAIMVLLATSFSQKDMFSKLQTSAIGQGLVILLIISLIILFYLSIYVGRFEFD